MFTVIGIMFIGLGLGLLLKRIQWLRHVSKTISYTIYLLLFLLGISVGANKEIVNNLGTLGWQAFILAFAGAIGSALAALIVYKCFFESKEVNNER
ncbi:MAG: LysO family transporter [Bacteroidales bacterium]